MSTPHLDRLASEGLVFDRAYTQFAYCAPSRASFLTGRRPERTKVLNFDSVFRDHHPDWTSMPQFFKNHGYFTTAAGKLYHDGDADDALSWTYGLGNPLGSNFTAWIQCQCDGGDACDEFFRRVDIP